MCLVMMGTGFHFVVIKNILEPLYNSSPPPEEAALAREEATASAAVVTASFTIPVMIMVNPVTLVILLIDRILF
jgi:hypothetical protein